MTMDAASSTAHRETYTVNGVNGPRRGHLVRKLGFTPKSVTPDRRQVWLFLSTSLTANEAHLVVPRYEICLITSSS